MVREQRSPTSPEAVLEAVRGIATEFAQQRHERQRRRHLDKQDFERLKNAGYLLLGVPSKHGGLFRSVEESTRVLCEVLRTLAAGDSSVALVASMHPAVTYSGGWLVEKDARAPWSEEWQAQRRFVFETALAGHWWGTITSEPGSGGNIMNTRATARATGDGKYALSGTKHFGSGSGITSFMLTTAVPETEDAPDWFFLDMRGVPWDGTSGVELVAEWDGHGMIATQSHGMTFREFPATRTAYPGAFTRESTANPGFVPCIYTAVIAGVVHAAMEEARRKLEERKDTLNPFEQVEWLRAQQEAWLVEQALEGMLRATESENGRNTLMGKMVVAELAEALTSRLCKIMGGGTYARHSPFGFWAQDVKALGFLRPPWALAFDTALEASWNDSYRVRVRAEGATEGDRAR